MVQCGRGIRVDGMTPRLIYYSVSALLAMQTAVLAKGIPSVFPSHSPVLSRRMKIRSCGFQHQVGQSLYFLGRYSLSGYSQGIIPSEQWRREARASRGKCPCWKGLCPCRKSVLKSS